VHSVFYNQHRVLIVFNRTHPLAGRETITMADLHGEPMIVRKSSSTTQAAFDKAASDAGVSITPAFEIESREGLREAIIRGLGIGVISETEFAPHPDLRALEVSDAKMFTRAYIACLKARENRPLISEFFALAKRLSDAHRR
jgi:DNA-binding transcriptional LysR family regulator